jgi:AmpD protein
MICAAGCQSNVIVGCERAWDIDAVESHVGVDTVVLRKWRSLNAYSDVLPVACPVKRASRITYYNALFVPMSHPHIFNVDAASGYLTQARQVTSPNFDARPGDSALDLIVVHGISLPPNDFGGPSIEQLFTNTLPWEAHPYFKVIAGLKASSHLLIRRDGELVQFVSFLQRAWHAGVSNYGGRERCNDFSIGIELEGADDVAYEPIQYRILAATVGALCNAYSSLSRERLVGHSDIAPGRKTDPGESFDWARLRALLKVLS